MVNGWGVWLESIEITDVMISSTRVFKDMQTRFREKERRKAQLAKMETDLKLEINRLEKQLLNDKRQIQIDYQVKISSELQALSVKKQKQEVYQKTAELEKQKIQLECNDAIYVMEKESETELAQIREAHCQDLAQLEKDKQLI